MARAPVLSSKLKDKLLKNGRREVKILSALSLLVDQPLRRAMLNLLGFTDILGIEQGTARSTRAVGSAGSICVKSVLVCGRSAERNLDFARPDN